MESALLVILGIVVLALGSAVTFMLVWSVPQAVFARAQEHGRYAGLSAEDSGGGPGKTITTGYPNLGKQLINVF
jgi:hypothetical protein